MAANTCPDGFECLVLNLVTPVHPTHSCAAGHYCVAGVKNACAAGTYNPKTGSTSAAACLTVPAGYYTDTEGSSSYTVCTAGYICAAGSSTAKPAKCPGGEYKLLTAGGNVACGDCPSGYYCPPLATVPIVCPSGFYCEDGVSYPAQCPRATF